MTEHIRAELQESWYIEIRSDGSREQVSLTAYVDLARIVQAELSDLDFEGDDVQPVLLYGDTEEDEAAFRRWLHTEVDWATWDPEFLTVRARHNGREVHAQFCFLWDFLNAEEMSIHLRDGFYGDDMEYWRVMLTPELSEKDGVRCWKLTGVSPAPPT